MVVACALIMCSVFFSFMLGDQRAIKEFGLGLGIAIAIDAFVVRLVIVPAVMQILGERAWYMPRVARAGDAAHHDRGADRAGRRRGRAAPAR